MNTENAEAATPEASRSSDLSEELQSKAFCQLHWYPCTSINYDGSQRAGFAIWTMAASVLAYPLQL